MTGKNPLIQGLALVAATALLGLAFVIGAVVIGVLLALGAVAAIAIAIRIWWLQRKVRAAAATGTSGPSARQVIEGDYTVVGARASRPRSLPRDDARGRPRDPAD